METCETTKTDEQQSICKFYLENRCRFADQCRNLHPANEFSQQDNQTENAKRPTATTTVQRTDSSRKGKMRTASDVIHRISWDPALDCSQFWIVYTDRFTGLVTIPLTEFVSRNTDPTATGLCDSSIPQHRIQQIFYQTNENIVWDKQNRIDRVFGSTGFDGDIFDFINSSSQKQNDELQKLSDQLEM